MKHYYYRNKQKYKKVIGIALAIIGIFIIINTISMEILFIAIGIVLAIMGFLLLDIK